MNLVTIVTFSLLYSTKPKLNLQFVHGEQQGRHWIYFPENGGYVRKLTLNECYKIMGFPNDFKKDSTRSYAYKQIGNTVAVPVIKAICKQIIEQNLLSD